MKYTVKSKQNLDGVQTLANDPLATYQVASCSKRKAKRAKKP